MRLLLKSVEIILRRQLPVCVAVVAGLGHDVEHLAKLKALQIVQ